MTSNAKIAALVTGAVAALAMVATPAVAATGQITGITGKCPADSCSGLSQQPWDYTRVIAAYTG